MWAQGFPVVSEGKGTPQGEGVVERVRPRPWDRGDFILVVPETPMALRFAFPEVWASKRAAAGPAAAREVLDQGTGPSAGATEADYYSR
jgi:hypothetical protein